MSDPANPVVFKIRNFELTSSQVLVIIVSIFIWALCKLALVKFLAINPLRAGMFVAGILVLGVYLAIEKFGPPKEEN